MDNLTIDTVFHDKALAILVRESNYLHTVPEIRPEIFELADHRLIAEASLRFASEFTKSPSLIEINDYLQRRFAEKLQAFTSEEINDLLEHIYRMEDSDLNYVRREHFIPFLVSNGIKRFLNQDMDGYLSRKDYRGFLSELRAIVGVADDDGNIGVFFPGGDVESVELDVLSTLVAPIDKLLSRNPEMAGLGKGELGLIVAGPGGGKSIALVNIARGAMVQNKKVVFISLEMSEARVIDRMDRSAYSVRRWDDDYDGIMEYRRKFYPEGCILFKQMVAKSANVMTFEHFLNKIDRLEGFVPDLLIIDYLDEMKAVAGKHSKPWEEVGQAIIELRDFAIEQDIPIWSASGITKDGSLAEDYHLADLKGSFDKSYRADVIIAWVQSKEQKEEQKGMFYSLKIRNDCKDKYQPFEIDYDKMVIR